MGSEDRRGGVERFAREDDRGDITLSYGLVADAAFRASKHARRSCTARSDYDACKREGTGLLTVTTKPKGDH